RRAPNPKDIDFQTAEIVIPNPQRDQLTIAQFDKLAEVKIDKTKMNRLIWGDNMLAMQALLASGYEGKINLIYIDPPFWTGEDYYANFVVEGKEITKEPSVIERLAYKDIWAGGIDSYLDMLYPRLQLMKRLLAENGSIYVHLDWHVVHYVKVMLDEIFGTENFVNEIVRQKTMSRKAQTKGFGNLHDTVLVYAKTEEYKFTPQIDMRDEKTTKTRFPEVELETRRRFVWDNFTQAGEGPPRRFGDKVIAPPPGKHWIWTQKRIDEAWAAGIIQFHGNMPRVKRYETEGVFAGDVWIGKQWVIHSQSQEALGFDTQKSKTVLDRIIKASSNEGDLVADFFPGS
ncbi:MAG: site-specific DNA-methyltransferase, partial [Methanophagales archaeon]|nr:site-specific DNA-methyltransferase [Methanophagales archaeon]